MRNLVPPNLRPQYYQGTENCEVIEATPSKHIFSDSRRLWITGEMRTICTKRGEKAQMGGEG